MSITRVILCIVFPPFAVMDKGCGSILIVCLLTLVGWAPGSIAALIILNKDGSLRKGFETPFVVTMLFIFIGFVFFLSLIYVLFRR